MRLGYRSASFHFPDSEQSAFDSAMTLARRLEDAGFDWFSTTDHLWQLPFFGTALVVADTALLTDDDFFAVYEVLVGQVTAFGTDHTDSTRALPDSSPKFPIDGNLKKR